MTDINILYMTTNKIFLKPVPDYKPLLEKVKCTIDKGNAFLAPLPKWNYIVECVTPDHVTSLIRSANFYTFENCYAEYQSRLLFFKMIGYTFNVEAFNYVRLNKENGYDTHMTICKDGQMSSNDIIADFGVDKDTFIRCALKSKIFTCLYEHIYRNDNVITYPIGFYYELFDNTFKFVTLCESTHGFNLKMNQIYVNENNKNADAVTQYLHCKIMSMIKKYGHPNNNYFNSFEVTCINDLMLTKNERFRKELDELQVKFEMFKERDRIAKEKKAQENKDAEGTIKEQLQTNTQPLDNKNMNILPLDNKIIDAPLDNKIIDAPLDNKIIDAPTNILPLDNKNIDAPTNILPLGTKNIDAPLDNKNIDAPTNILPLDNKNIDAPTNILPLDTKNIDAPLDNKNIDAPTNILPLDNKNIDAPINILSSDNKIIDAPTNILPKDASTNII
jgi:hypothetical protein